MSISSFDARYNNFRIPLFPAIFAALLSLPSAAAPLPLTPERAVSESNVLAAPQRVFQGAAGSLLDFDVAALGNTFIVASSERATDGTFVIRGRSFDSGGNLIGGMPFDLSPIGANAVEVALSSSPHRMTVNYTRVASDAGDVERVFTRSIDDMQRQRSVRH